MTRTKKNSNEVEVKIISVDNGKALAKAVCSRQELIYENRYKDGHTDDLTEGNETFNVTYQNKEILIGKQGSNYDPSEGKATEFHKISTLTSITRFLEPDTMTNVVLLYGESVDLYYDKNNKDAIVEMLLGEHEITVEDYEGEKNYKFNIIKVQVMPEGIGHILQDLETYCDMQYVVDFGGTTVNFLSVIDGVPERDSSFSMPLGKNHILSDLGTEIKRAGFNNTPDRLIRLYFEKGANIDEINKIIKKVKKQAFDNIENNITTKLNTNIRKLLQQGFPVTFVGGTSKLLKNDILEYFSTIKGIAPTIKVDAPTSNVWGMLAFGEAKFGDMVGTK